MAICGQRIYQVRKDGDNTVYYVPLTAVKTGMYKLARSCGIKSNLAKNSVEVETIEEVIELLRTREYKLWMVPGHKDRSAKALLIFESISIPEIGHYQDDHSEFEPPAAAG